MAYSSYISEITQKLVDLDVSIGQVIGNLDLDTVWSGSAFNKQDSNLETIKTEIYNQITNINNYLVILVDIDKYDDIRGKINLAYENRTNLDSDSKDYQVNYEYYTSLIYDYKSDLEIYKNRIDAALAAGVSSYSQQFFMIPKTELISTSDVFNDAIDAMSQLDGAFNLENIISPTGLRDEVLYPDFSNKEAWVTLNPFAGANTGQCTWFAWGRFYEIYGYSPGFTSHGRYCAQQLIDAHSDKFEYSDVPVPGAVFSTRHSQYGHVGIVIAVDYENGTMTIQDGNYNGQSDSFAVAQSDWGTRDVSISSYGGGTTYYAVPKK